jgi:hypothetical protein
MKSSSSSWPWRWGVPLAAFGFVAAIAGYAAGTPPGPGATALPAATVVSPDAKINALEKRVQALEVTVLYLENLQKPTWTKKECMASCMGRCKDGTAYFKGSVAACEASCPEHCPPK